MLLLLVQPIVGRPTVLAGQAAGMARDATTWQNDPVGDYQRERLGSYQRGTLGNYERAALGNYRRRRGLTE